MSEGQELPELSKEERTIYFTDDVIFEHFDAIQAEREEGGADITFLEKFCTKLRNLSNSLDISDFRSTYEASLEYALLMAHFKHAVENERIPAAPPSAPVAPRPLPNIPGMSPAQAMQNLQDGLRGGSLAHGTPPALVALAGYAAPPPPVPAHLQGERDVGKSRDARSSSVGPRANGTSVSTLNPDEVHVSVKMPVVVGKKTNEDGDCDDDPPFFAPSFDERTTNGKAAVAAIAAWKDARVTLDFAAAEVQSAKNLVTAAKENKVRTIEAADLEVTKAEKNLEECIQSHSLLQEGVNTKRTEMNVAKAKAEEEMSKSKMPRLDSKPVGGTVTSLQGDPSDSGPSNRPNPGVATGPVYISAETIAAGIAGHSNIFVQLASPERIATELRKGLVDKRILVKAYARSVLDTVLQTAFPKECDDSQTDIEAVRATVEYLAKVQKP